MAKVVTYLITFIILFGLLPYIAYTAYYKHQDGLYISLTEVDSYTTLDKNYSIKTMKYNSVRGEEICTFKVYLVDENGGTEYFLKNVVINSEDAEITYSDTEPKDGIIKVIYSNHAGTESKMVQVDCKTKTPPGKKLRNGWF
ncbi:MAG: hypothetical protein IIZ73_05260 [Ruminococcus sp.]|nr:hypothetical protein [Ruminococcus sp.]